MNKAQVITPTESPLERKGIHYLFPDFQKAQIIREDGNSSEGNLNYNLLTEEVIIDLGSSKVAYSQVNDVQSIRIGETELIPVDGVIYEVLENGPVSLIVHRKQTMERTGQETGLGRTSGTYSNSTNTYSSEPDFLPTLKDKQILYQLILPGKFGLIDVNTYYLLHQDELLPLRRWKQLESLYPKISDNLKDFIKKEKLKIDQEDDLVQAIRFCNMQGN